ncbi:gamma-glutamylcyclotransferase family protein [Lunatimonas salinarum]|uniref:gamma-glutamylcyclotransferase family protein n=1 Tax=Lunatimonas salinarum TaxID=1774590 RepID=UPI001ADFFB2D
MDFLFVYGTLRSDYGHPLGRLLEENATFLGSGHVNGYLYDLGEYPGIKLDAAAEARVIGEIYRLRLANKILTELDKYEGVSESYTPDFPYRRIADTVFLAGERYPNVWIYEYQGDTVGLPRILDGDYLAYLREKGAK